MPNQCSGFVRDGDGLLANCGNDLVRLAADGKITKLFENVGTDNVMRSDRIYWTGISLAPNPALPGIPTLFALESSGGLANLKVAEGTYFPALTERYAYLDVRGADGHTLSRLPLSEVK